MTNAAQAGYSGTPLWKKLGLRPGMRWAVLNRPPHYAELLAGHPEGFAIVSTPADADAIHHFITGMTELAIIPAHARLMPPVTMLWVSWPKLTSKLSTGLREDDIRAAALACGLVDIKVCAVDADWSGLKLVRRKA